MKATKYNQDEAVDSRRQSPKKLNANCIILCYYQVMTG